MNGGNDGNAADRAEAEALAARAVALFNDGYN